MARRRKPAPDHQQHSNLTSHKDRTSTNGGGQHVHRNGRSHSNRDTFSNNAESKSVKPYGIQSFIFPTWTPWLVFVVTLVFRVQYVSRKVNWWILHPDEVFQSVEVAYSEVYGYGVRAYEFMPPPQGELYSHARRQEAELGMHSLRSFLYPRILMIVMLIGDIFGARPYWITKVFHAAICSLLPLASYFFTSAIFRCHDTASLASILVAFSVHLTVFGTHTLVNSFVAPVVLFCLVPIFKQLLSGGSNQDIVESDMRVNDYTTETERVQISKYVINGKSAKGLNGINSTFPTYSQSQANGSVNARTAALLMLAGFGLGVVCYIRIDLVLFLAVIVLPHCLQIQSKSITLRLDLHLIVPTLFGFSSGITFGGFEDWCSYGVWFISPYQWLRFNVGLDFATILFGKQALGFYLQNIVFHNAALSVLFLCFLVLLCYGIGSSEFRGSHLDTIFIILRLFVSAVSLVTIYSLKGHKEIRFMHNFVVLLLVIYSSTIISLTKQAISRGWTMSHVKWGIYLLLLLYVANQRYVMPSSGDKSNRAWVYNAGWDSNYVNDCFDFISQQNDVRGVFVDRSIHTTAAFSVLRHDVPLLAVIHYELYEFDKDAYVQFKPVSMLSKARTINVRTLSSISNYITVYNSREYLLKLLLSKKCYNYLVMKKEKNFMAKGYQEVYTSGTMRVLRRTYDTEAEKFIEKYANQLPIGSNSTVLEYEASWLLTFGLHNLAEERLLAALQLSNPTARIFQMLVKIFLDQNKMDQARKAEQMCINQLGVEECRKTQPRIILHKEYDIDLSR